MITAEYGSLTIESCSFTSNYGYSGGVFAFYDYLTVIIKNCVIKNSVATLIGGVINSERSGLKVDTSLILI